MTLRLDTTLTLYIRAYLRNHIVCISLGGTLAIFLAPANPSASPDRIFTCQVDGISKVDALAVYNPPPESTSFAQVAVGGLDEAGRGVAKRLTVQRGLNLTTNIS